MKTLIKPYHLFLFALIFLAGCSITPQPFSTDDIALIAQADRELIFNSQEPIEGELTLELAMALALKYNLENRVMLLEETVANQQLDMSKLDLLPSLAVNAGYLDRDNINASTSVSVETGNVSLEPSTSQQQQQFNSSGRFTWNLLDFGVSYLQAKQDADRYLIAKKSRQKVMLALLKEVRAAYWNAVAMEQMSGELDEISLRVDGLLDYWQSIRDQQLRAPVAVLMDIRGLIETRQQLGEIRRVIDTAHAKLANLINADSFSDLHLPKSLDFPKLLEVSNDIESMEMVALTNSAEYATEVYKVRIEQLESRKTMMRLLPGLEFSYGESYDDNSFLYNSNWGELGINLTADLTRLMSTRQIKKFRETNEQLTINRKLAINMAVITGVHITWQDYRNSLTSLGRAEYLQEIDQEISQLTSNAQANQAESGAAAIQSEFRAFRSKISRLQSYAGAQEAYGGLMVSLGLNPVPVDYQRYSVEGLAEKVSSNLDQQMFRFTKQGEALIAEREKFDRWVAQKEIDAERQARIDAEREAQQEERRRAQRIVEAQEVAERALVLEQEREAEEIKRLAEAQEQKKMEELQRLADAAGRREPVVAASAAPDLGQYLSDFWIRNIPHPDLDAYLKRFLDRMKDSPDRIDYLEMFMNQMRSSPNSSQYLNEFRALIEE